MILNFTAAHNKQMPTYCNDSMTVYQRENSSNTNLKHHHFTAKSSDHNEDETPQAGKVIACQYVNTESQAHCGLFLRVSLSASRTAGRMSQKCESQ